MEIKDRIAKLGSIFKEMQITNVDGAQIIYVVVSFPQNWIIDNDIEEKFRFLYMLHRKRNKSKKRKICI